MNDVENFLKKIFAEVNEEYKRKRNLGIMEHFALIFKEENSKQRDS